MRATIRCDAANGFAVISSQNQINIIRGESADISQLEEQLASTNWKHLIEDEIVSLLQSETADSASARLDPNKYLEHAEVARTRGHSDVPTFLFPQTYAEAQSIDDAVSGERCLIGLMYDGTYIIGPVTGTTHSICNSCAQRRLATNAGVPALELSQNSIIPLLQPSEEDLESVSHFISDLIRSSAASSSPDSAVALTYDPRGLTLRKEIVYPTPQCARCNPSDPNIRYTPWILSNRDE